MAQKTLSAIVKQRINTAAGWASANPVLQDGQIGVERDNGQVKFKVGDGVTAWNTLPYFTVEAAAPTQSMVTLTPFGNWSNLPVDKDFLFVKNIYSQSTLQNFSYVSLPPEGWTQKILFWNTNSMSINLMFPTQNGYAFYGESGSSLYLAPNTRMEFFVIYQDSVFHIFQMTGYNHVKPI